MRVLVTGGKGELGRRVVPRLLAAGHDVRIGTRAARPRDDEGVEVVFRHDHPRSIDDAVGDTDVVVHLASDPTHPTDDITMMERLVAAVHGSPEVRHLLYVSIVGIDGHAFPYYRAKVTCERALHTSRVPWTTLRATQFHGLPGRLAAELGIGPVGIAPARLPFQPVDPEVVADRVAWLVEKGPSGRVTDLGGPEVLDLRHAMQRSLRAAGRQRWLVPVRVPARFGGEAFRRGAVLLPPSGEVAGCTFQDHLDAEVAGGLSSTRHARRDE